MTGAELRQLRESTGLDQKAFAALLPVHWQTLYKWEKGERRAKGLSPVVAQRIRDVVRQVLEGRSQEIR